VQQARNRQMRSTAPFCAAYRALHRQGALAERAEAASALLSDCTLCPRLCHADRFAGREGRCRTGARPVVSAAHPHFGEEAPLSGRGGSGTIFFGSCNLLCVFCQNWSTSRAVDAREVSARDLGELMLALERQGCHNINLVTPSHMVPQILAALLHAVEAGLSAPLVYNTSGYDRVETLRLLDGVIDIYMPDVKFLNHASGRRYADAEDYPDVVRAAVAEMHRQVGDLVVDEEGLARRGLLVRHLVMPGGLEDTREVCRFLAHDISEDTYLNLMDQYRPCGVSSRFPEIARMITTEEFDRALEAARLEGLRRLDRDVGRRRHLAW
jgi:putative pyruvate formate lyase activating enzyme